MTERRAWLEYFEEYAKCGCVSENASRLKDLPGYCAKHGNSRRNVFRDYARGDRSEIVAQSFITRADRARKVSR